MSRADWLHACEVLQWPVRRGVCLDGPSNARIREALGKACEACGGMGHARAENDNICPLCGGTGKASVLGARLLARQSHVEVR